MTFRIETVARGNLTIFVLSGRIDKQAIPELKRLCDMQASYRGIVFDLKDVGVIDRNALHFFKSCELDGVMLENCPQYIREWMEREKD